ncbi:MAG: hydrogenase maturation peptidase HycI [Candidatus Thermoplasmatota archaeon]
MKAIVMCIGNIDGGDDAVGPYIADKLKKTPGLKVINAGTTPENYTGVIKKEKPDKLFIVDAVEMGLKPGETRVVPSDKIGSMHISTHGIPVSVLIKYLKTFVEKIFLIGIQPSKMSGGISEKVASGADRLIKTLKKQEINNLKTLK